MAGVLTFVKLLLSVVDGLMSYFNKKQLLDAGEHIAQSKNLQKAMEEQREAEQIRERVRRGELDDPFVRK